MQAASGELRALPAALPAATEVAEGLIGLQRVDARAVVRYTHRLNRAERVGDEIDFDLLGVCVERVPDKLFDCRKRRALEEGFDVVGLGLDEDLLHGI